jgi:hypothetical protein
MSTTLINNQVGTGPVLANFAFKTNFNKKTNLVPTNFAFELTRLGRGATVIDFDKYISNALHIK